jgi:diguanylate cyclase (GGDEF)-like protein/PAS domain S-box-containing protein
VKTRLAVRSTAFILLLAGFLGLVFLLLAMKLVSDQERRRQDEQLQGLLNTVDSTLQIAVFLGDRQLATEVVRGLLSNSTVTGVTIRGDSGVLAESRAPPGATDSILPPSLLQTIFGRMTASATLERPVSSPFDDQVVGSIRLIPNQDAIASQVERSTLLVMALLAVQMVFIGFGVVYVVVRYITKPIASISHRLHKLRAETGEQLAPPRGNEEDEIGQLVNDVNAIIDHLVKILGAERELRMQREVDERKFRAIFDNAESAIFLVDSLGQVQSWNPAFARHFAVPGELLAGQQTIDLKSLVAEGGDNLLEQFAQCRREGTTSQLEVNVRHQPGHWLQLSLTAVDDELVQGVANDISERMLAEQAALQRAMTDPLTGLGNRAGFETRLTRLLRTRGEHPDFALLMLDLDHFKAVNDTHGHQAGDLVLQVIGERLSAATRHSDYVARLGGDEFVVLLEGVSDAGPIRRLADNLLVSLIQPIPLDDRQEISVAVGASIGIAFATPGCTMAQLVRLADNAMYEAKNNGRNQYRLVGD